MARHVLKPAVRASPRAYLALPLNATDLTLTVGEGQGARFTASGRLTIGLKSTDDPETCDIVSIVGDVITLEARAANAQEWPQGTELARVWTERDWAETIDNDQDHEDRILDLERTTGTAAESLAQFDCVTPGYGGWVKACSDDPSNATGPLAIALEAIDDGETGPLLLQGVVHNPAWNVFASPGMALIVSTTTPGALEWASGTGRMTRIVGFVVDGTGTIYWNPASEDETRHYEGPVVLPWEDAGEAIAVNQVVHLASSGVWMLAKADSLANCSGPIGIAVTPGVSEEQFQVMVAGYMWSGPSGLDPGPVYISAATAGAVTQTAPEIRRVLGYAGTYRDLIVAPAPEPSFDGSVLAAAGAQSLAPLIWYRVVSSSGGNMWGPVDDDDATAWTELLGITLTTAASGGVGIRVHMAGPLTVPGFSGAVGARLYIGNGGALATTPGTCGRAIGFCLGGDRIYFDQDWLYRPLRIADGGTGTTSAPDDGEVLIGSGGAYVQRALTAADAGAAPAAKGVTNGDSHDHSGGDGGQIAYSGLSGVPSTFAPSAHKTSHATAGGDAIAPADIGAATSDHDHAGTYLPVEVLATGSNRATEAIAADQVVFYAGGGMWSIADRANADLLTATIGIAVTATTGGGQDLTVQLGGIKSITGFSGTAGLPVYIGAAGAVVQYQTGEYTRRELGISLGGTLVLLTRPNAPEPARLHSHTYTATGALVAGTHIALVDATAGAVVITLPAPQGGTLGQTFVLKKIDASANGVSFTSGGSPTIDGSTSTTPITTQYGTIRVISDGANWWIV